MKRLFCVIPLVFLLCLAFGCQDKAVMAELEEYRAQAAVEEQNVALIRSLVEELNKGSLEFINKYYAPDFLFYSPSNNPKPLSLGETQEFMKMLLKSFPDFNMSIEEIFAVKDRVIVRYIYRASHKEDWQGIPASGNKFEISSIIIITIKDGKIIEEREEADMLGMMMQLGMELKPKEVKK